jgi:hypothetical protein
MVGTARSDDILGNPLGIRANIAEQKIKKGPSLGIEGP